jgi:hypothetical protein
MKEEAQVLKKLLNHKIFMEKFPIFKHVWVDTFGSGIDVIFMFQDGYEYSDYKEIKSSAREMVYQLARIASVNSSLNIYPQ